MIFLKAKNWIKHSDRYRGHYLGLKGLYKSFILILDIGRVGSRFYMYLYNLFLDTTDNSILKSSRSIVTSLCRKMHFQKEWVLLTDLGTTVSDYCQSYRVMGWTELLFPSTVHI